MSDINESKACDLLVRQVKTMINNVSMVLQQSSITDLQLSIEKV